MPYYQFPIPNYQFPKIMNHLSLKSLAFYGIAIGSVSLLFKVVTAYGETNLKAAPPIAGSYRFDAKSLPECLKSDTLVLTIEQSGVYLSGNLRSGNSEADRANTAEEKPSLVGKWENQGLSLSGAVPNLTGCSNSRAIGQNSYVKLRGIVEKDTLKGKISLTDRAAATNFTAQREMAAKPQQKQPH
ncbi:MAG: hypothetical protein JGK17_23645 [Microcoleus sp. PH2017_10_PVI_O_A]|uniref:hypothetical protein n=1 Tax=Microcoleus sp. PH2017_27_LUM_O_A TaxID=2798837 RepID=UPI001D321F5E|nr:hypothetical protein [Microcoleus sp. PH2017_27_LUM_O_A]MCC3408522.1 hypothetical protein [Microcoleus sp. PH2017_10_PVI_O_A]MCC3462624.1 hypothetical protein [Microcoleus sp. PH2017_11_PCY_U_A]MCC3481031.1 hypothetical protein [Microcoleus sp. PH2017_12_PCY_D_A]TAE79143.1 MAG: hypothetical protein EAZ83_22640 [Oscillatoriales cyanobacterium]MCC3562012.1 hypothetical protein [Microcoleus sp. PH2017_27_LUM_O_A]